ncbi:hypothetical protein [Hymenobacter cellulosilyticus]|uniref:Uncharacterized protein n=1 Tax=Hymenobacter cellulosilyticus TaxID=2932248 RepID=A0A8T9QCN1_9BACT|nr:hypothetical protein [Hymenobacter cellulosilyticus]UOQ75296.1 hypothetical protein MUN79_29350 [Hymenobacter cellulosilyticus]
MKSEEMTRDLVTVPKVLRRLAEQNAEWQPLAKVLFALDSDAKVPTGKKLQQDLGISPSKYRRWLDALYAAYLHLLESDADAVPFKQVEHQLILTGQRASQTFSCRLPITPRVGEQLQLDFLRAVTGEYMFYVENIIHDLTDGRYSVLVYLKHGYYNAYQHQLKERSRFEETIGLDVFFHAPDFLLDDLLRERYPPPAESSKAEEALDKAEARYGRRSLFGRRRR